MAGRKRNGSTGARPPRDEVLEKQHKVLVLRAAGASYEEIAKAVGYANRQNARAACLAALNAQVHEAVDSLRNLEGARLDRLQRAIWSAALSGDLNAMDRVLRIMDARARLYGLNAPTKLEITDEIDREIQMLAASLGSDETWDITGIPADVGEGEEG